MLTRAPLEREGGYSPKDDRVVGKARRTVNRPMPDISRGDSRNRAGSTACGKGSKLPPQGWMADGATGAEKQDLGGSHGPIA